MSLTLPRKERFVFNDSLTNTKDLNKTKATWQALKFVIVGAVVIIFLIGVCYYIRRCLRKKNDHNARQVFDDSLSVSNN